VYRVRAGVARGAGGAILDRAAGRAPPAVPFSAPLAIAFAGAALLQGFGGVLPAVGDYLQKKRGPAFIWSKLAKSR
jgi:hypothetical protein